MTGDTAPTITAEGVRAAAARLDGVIVKTPLLENKTLNERTGGRILLKAEALQHFGSFKLRGASAGMTMIARTPSSFAA